MVLSAALGAMLGMGDAFLALRPFCSVPFEVSPRRAAWRFVLRLAVLAAILASCLRFGAAMVPLVVALVGGFLIQATWTVRRILQ